MSDPTSDPRPSALDVIHRMTDDELRLFGRLVAILAAPKLVRTERLELVDDEGNVRVVLGNLAGSAEDEDYYPGVALRDATGRDRTTLLVHDAGPVLAFTLEGNDALLVGVDDHHPGTDTPGPYVELVDRAGDVALGWRVSEAGVEEHRAGAGDVN